MLNRDFYITAVIDTIKRHFFDNEETVTIESINRVVVSKVNELILSCPDLFSKEDKQSLIDVISHAVENEFVVVDFFDLDAAESQNIKYEKITAEELMETEYYYWEKYRKYKKRTRTESFINAQSKDVDRILKMMPSPCHPENTSFKSLGMVIGDVQAGKTGNYSVLINKAADLGYKLIIVLAGMTKNLRSQTQARLDEDFIGATSEAGKQAGQQGKFVGIGVGTVQPNERSMLPYSLTDQLNDFNKQKVANFNLDSINSPVVVVTQKNSSILKNLITFLLNQVHGESYKNIIDTPTLIIDDESDNASVDTSKEDEDPKAINHKIRMLVNMCKRVSYVAYTATPYANIFIDPELTKMDKDSGEELIDLYPRDFIVALKAPSNYCGGSFFYSDDEDIEYATSVKKYIDDAEEIFPLNHKKNHSVDALPHSLHNAIYEFIIAIAIKSIRRRNGVIPHYDKHDSMLINVSRFTDFQNEVYKQVDTFIQLSIIEQLFNASSKNSASPFWDTLKQVYLSHYCELLKDKITWDEIRQELIFLVKENPNFVKVVAIHGQSKDDLYYGKEPQRYIAIGGFKLSRGLTLEGLTVSYFYRRSIMYDTLMQMARWFGYRDGYRDLIRLYTTKECATWYDKINKATIELKEYLVDMERQKKEPTEFGISVRSTEEALIVTARNKMQSAEQIVLNLDYSGGLYENFFVDPRLEKAQENLEIGNCFVAKIADDLKRILPEQYGNGYIAHKINGFEITEFLRRLHLHSCNQWVFQQTLIDFINDNVDGAYKHWDVVILDVKGGAEHQFTKAPKIKIGKAKRTTSFKRKKVIPAEHLIEQNTFQLPLGDNGRVSSEGVELSGLFKKDYENAKALRSHSDKKESDDRIARKFRQERNMDPVLILQIVDIDLKDDAILLAEEKQIVDLMAQHKTHLAVYISLPGEGKTKVKKYTVNKNYIKEYYGEAESDDGY